MQHWPLFPLGFYLILQGKGGNSLVLQRSFQMASTITFDKPRTSFLALLAAPFVGLGKLLVLIAEASPKVRELERLSELSDAQLARRGLTRDGEIRRILGVAALI